MPNGFIINSSLLNNYKYKFLIKYFILFTFFINIVQSSLLLGALFQNNGFIGNNTIDSDEEIVFKHAVYVSNQLKLTFSNPQQNHLTLLHKIIDISKVDQLKTIKKICKDTSGNILALIGPQGATLKLYVQSLCEQLDLIHFDVEPSLEASYSFNLYPSVDVLCQAFVDLIKKFEWKHTAIIYDSKTNLKKVRCLLGGPGQSIPKLDLTLKIANYEYEYRIILRDIAKRRFKNIILDLEPEEAQVVLKMALQLGMINSSYHYILTSLDAEAIDLDDYKYNRANITALRFVKTDSQFFKSMAMNLSDYYFNTQKEHEKSKILLKTKFALMFDAVYAFATAVREAQRTLSLTSGNVSCAEDRPLAIGNTLSTFVERVSVQGLTGLVTFQNKQRKDFELDVLQLKETGLFKSGVWSTETGLNFTFFDEVFDDEYYLSRKNFFRVVTLVENPYVIEENGKFKGFCIDLLNEIAQKMNFRYEIYKVADNNYGSEVNGTWNGMIRELIDKKADLAISAFTINFKRQQVVDFSKPFLSLGISILYKIPTSSKPGLFSFLNPLSFEIWMYTLITYLLVSLFMMVLARFSPYEWRNTHPCNLNNDYVENQFTAWNSLWFAVGTLMQQGSDINPKALSTRLVGGVWWFFTLIIISSYTANLAAFLTVEKVDIKITNVEELANQTKVSYGCFGGGSTLNFFKESRIETYKRMYRQMEANPKVSYVTSNEEGIQRVLNTDYAYLMESPLIDYAIQQNCNLTQIGGLLDSKGYGIATQQGSPYTDDISLKILEMQEKGEIQKLYNKWWKEGSTCIRDEKKDSKASALNVQNVGGIFVVLVIGLLLAVFVSIIEFIYYAKTNKKRINKPIFQQMVEEFKFAIKCGGPAKKVRLSSTAAIPMKQIGNQEKLLETPYNEQPDQIEWRKYQEKHKNEIINKVRPDNAIVCKSDPSMMLSSTNPGILIVERDLNNYNYDTEENDDDENYESTDPNELYSKRFKYVMPNSHQKIVSPMNKKPVAIVTNTHQISNKKSKVLERQIDQELAMWHKSRKQQEQSPKQQIVIDKRSQSLNPKSPSSKKMQQQQHQQQLQQQLQQQQHLYHNQDEHPIRYQPPAHHKSSYVINNNHGSSAQVIPIKIDYNTNDEEQNEQQINYDKYLSKSNIVKK